VGLALTSKYQDGGPGGVALRRIAALALGSVGARSVDAERPGDFGAMYMLYMTFGSDNWCDLCCLHDVSGASLSNPLAPAVGLASLSAFTNWFYLRENARDA
jgi:hypothetical protein